MSCALLPTACPDARRRTNRRNEFEIDIIHILPCCDLHVIENQKSNPMNPESTHSSGEASPSVTVLIEARANAF